jgi:hypothetical protein
MMAICMFRPITICSPLALVSRFGVAELDLAFLAGFQERLLATLRHAADVEGPHRQLGAGFADGLGGDDADRFTDVHQRAAGKVATIAHGADALFGLAGQRAADADRGDARAC